MRYSNLSKWILLLGVVACGCHSAVKQQPVNKPTHDAIFNGVFAKDSVWICADADTTVLKKNELNLIAQNYPELIKGFPVDPDQDYALLKSKPQTKGDTVFKGFASEQGKDEYCTIYAYFLKIRNGDQYKGRRDTIKTIYQTINSINQTLRGGGTFFGHQYARIGAYAEYAIYTYANYKPAFVTDGGIATQKATFMKAMRQMISYAVQNNPDTFPEKDKQRQQTALFKLTGDLDKLITDYFYLKKAQEFQSGYYGN